jgi:glyoxylase-like metal-dependent hydrolase (beta-lactamase superfamily II)
MTQAEFLTAHAVLDQRATHALADTCVLFALHGLEREHVDALAGRGNAYARGVPGAPRAVDRMIGGDTLRFGGGAWRVIPGYGHSPEHASLYAADRNVLISGDMLLPRISTNVSVWPANPDGDPLGRFLDSLDAFERLRGDALVLPSHGLPFRGIATRVAELRAHHAARLAELEAALAAAGRPMSAGELVPVLFRRPLDLQQRFFATGEAIAHLNHLWHAGASSVIATAARYDSKPRPTGTHVDDALLRPGQAGRGAPARAIVRSTRARRVDGLRRGEERQAARRLRAAAGSRRAQPVRRRARPRQGVHGARGEHVREPGEARRAAHRAVAAVREAVAELDDARVGRVGRPGR